MKQQPHDFFSGGSSELVFWSFRYFLGRRTAATCHFAQCLARAWPTLNPSDRKMIAAELKEAFRLDDENPDQKREYRNLGDSCDRENWELVRKAYQLDKEITP